MRVAVCQLNAREDRAANLAAARDLLGRAAAAGADLAVLPEYVDYLGPGRRRAQAGAGRRRVRGVLRRGRARAGHLGARRLVPRGRPGRRAHLQHVAGVRPAGELAAVYRKIHLYDVEIPGRVSYQESRPWRPATRPWWPTSTGVPIGLSICYDLRFPELYRRLADRRRARCWWCRRRS